jgi:hypothetical protein
MPRKSGAPEVAAQSSAKLQLPSLLTQDLIGARQPQHDHPSRADFKPIEQAASPLGSLFRWLLSPLDTELRRAIPVPFPQRREDYPQDC